jgi:hypothetical protein
MSARRTLCIGLVGVTLVAVACGNDDTSTPSTTVPSSSTTSTSVASTTSDVTTSTAASSTTTTAASTTTSTTVPPAAQLTISENGLGTAVFGADPDAVVAYVTSILGNRTTDTGWVDPFSFGACPGTEVRIVTWHDLSLFFSDESNVTAGRRHFFSYIYGPAFGAVIDPLGPATDAGIRIGSTVAELKGTYPTAVVNPADELGGPSFFIRDGLFGYLTGTSPADTITEFVGGIGCGE